jgi:hypothetical protein
MDSVYDKGFDFIEARNQRTRTRRARRKVHKAKIKAAQEAQPKIPSLGQGRSLNDSTSSK